MASQRDDKMIAERWEHIHIKELFEEALNCSPEERASFMDRLAQQDSAAASEVGELLSSFEKAGDFLVHPCCVAPDFLEDLEAEQQRFSPGDILCGRFRIVHLIGRGGMGEVYKAWDEELEDHVALKVLRLEISTHELFTARFRREIQLARKVTHPNVCRIFDSFKHPVGDGTYISVLSMELLQGQNLADYLKTKGRLTTAEAFPIVQQIIAGLTAIHAAGIVHRDLKPGNLVLVEESDSSTIHIKITDFGIAGHLPDGLSQAAQTEVSKLLGTPDYMAPEQLENARANVQSDIYSFGLVLYEMVTGSKPFAGASAWKRTSAEAPPARKLASDLPEKWNKTIACCLERNPAYRFQTAQAALESMQDGPSLAAKIPHKPLFIRLKRTARTRVGTIAIFFLLIVSLMAWAYRYYRLKTPSGKEPVGVMVLLTTITNTSQDPELNSVTEVLRSQLLQSAYMNLLDGSSIRDTLKLMARSNGQFDAATSREIAKRNGAQLVIFGTMSQISGTYKLDLDLEKVGAEPERPAKSWHFMGNTPDKNGLFFVIDRAALWVRRSIGEAEIDIGTRDRKPEDVTTDSWDALEFYSQGQKMAAEDRLEDAVQLFKLATEKDPNFAMAWMRAGDLLDNLGSFAEGLKYWQKALAVSGVRRLSLREELRIKGMYASDTGNLKSAIDHWSQYSIAYPNDYFGYFNRSYALMMLGRPEEAIEKLKQAERLNPSSYYIADHLAQYNLILGNFAETDNYIKRLRQMGHSEYADQIEGESSFLKGEYQHARDLFFGLRFARDPYLKSVCYYLEAAVLAEQGQYTQSINVLQQGIDLDLETGDSSDRADKLLALAYLYLKSDKREAGREAALKSLEAESGPRRMADVATLLARNGWISAAKRILDKLPKTDSAIIFRVARLRIRGEIFLAEGNIKQAVSVLSRAKELDQEKALLHDFWARALLAAGRTEEALREFEMLQQHPGQVWRQAEFYPPGYAVDLRFAYAALAARLGKPLVGKQVYLVPPVAPRGDTEMSISPLQKISNTTLN
jgi:serine/threonine protein kinase/tetratricopeptide (TPR) repeat protein